MSGRTWLLMIVVALFLFLSLGGSTLPPAYAQAGGGMRFELHYSSGPSGWVEVQTLIVESGCSGGHCGTEWKPGGQEGLFEKIGERTHRNQGEADNIPPGPPFGVHDPREQCASGLWAAGDWFHNGVWNSIWADGGIDWSSYPPTHHFYETWTSMSWEGWNFGEDDDCLFDEPLGTPQPTPTPQSEDDPLRCPDPTVYEPDITLVSYTRPQNPIVIGQDPQRQGVEFVINAYVPPVEYRYWERVQGKVCKPGIDWHGYSTCSYNGGDGHWELVWEDCVGDRASDPAMRCHKDDGTEGTRVAFCREQVIKYRDGVDTVHVEAHLSPSSQDWINNELSVRYPGAHVRQADWYKTASGASFGATGSSFVGVITLPLEDPGWYNSVVVVRTKGTPVSKPREGRWESRVPVYLKESTIIK